VINEEGKSCVDNKLAIITSHPIQYQTPIFKALFESGEIEFSVYFGSRHGISPDSMDTGFGRSFTWDIPLLEGYPYSFPSGFEYKDYCRRKWLLDIPGVEKILADDGITQVLLMVSWNTILFWRILSICRRNGIPLIYRGETVSAHWKRTTYWGKALGWSKKAIKRAGYPYFLRKIDLFLTVGTLPEQFLKEYGVESERMLSAPYCVDNDFFSRGVKEWKSSGQLQILRKKLSIPPDAKVIIYTGKFIPRKRPVDLIKAIKRLPGTMKVILVMVGDGVLIKEIRREAEGDNRIRLVGFQNQTDIIKFYALGDILVLPSLHETWGLSVNEAMASGLPVVVSEGCTCARDLVITGMTGYTYPPGDVGLLADRLEKILSDDALRREMALNAREKIKQFSVDTTVRAIIKASSRLGNIEPD
jgi:glycosyltransferase involved in cell wall biosynthesis